MLSTPSALTVNMTLSKALQTQLLWNALDLTVMTEKKKKKKKGEMQVEEFGVQGNFQEILLLL